MDERGVARPAAASGFLTPQNLLLMLGLAMQTLKDAIVKAIDTKEQVWKVSLDLCSIECNLL